MHHARARGFTVHTGYAVTVADEQIAAGQFFEREREVFAAGDASVHHTDFAAAVAKRVGLNNRQRVHVGTNTDAARASATFQLPDNTRAADTTLCRRSLHRVGYRGCLRPLIEITVDPLRIGSSPC